jgi:hypothetical protein
MMLWVLGFALSFCGLFIWLELGTMIPRSGGEKVYLEAIYRKPKYLATVVFAMNAILLGFTSAGCIVSLGFLLAISSDLTLYGRFLRRSEPPVQLSRIREGTDEMH